MMKFLFQFHVVPHYFENPPAIYDNFVKLFLEKMDSQNGNSSNSSSFEDLTKEAEVKDELQDENFMDILGNKQLTKKVGRNH